MNTITMLDSDPRVGSFRGYVLALVGRPTIVLRKKTETHEQPAQVRLSTLQVQE
jgi:hypothetical protein